METYHGYVRTPADAIKLFEACRLGLLPRVQRRLSEKERQSIRSGSVFVWDEREAGMRRWTDGKSWSASRVSGSFLTYREMEGKRGGGFGGNTTRRLAGKTPDSSGRGSDEDQDETEPDGYRYKADGLMKQSFSITTSQGQHLHLISYYSRPQPGQPELIQPSNDSNLRHIVPAKGMYPESSMNDAPGPALTRAPMHQTSPYAGGAPPPPPSQQAPPPTGAPQYGSPYGAAQGYSWPPSPISTPPYHYQVAGGAYPPQGQLPPPPPSAPSQQQQQQQQHYNPQQPPPYASGPSPYDRAPPLPPIGAGHGLPQRRTPPPSLSSYCHGPPGGSGSHLSSNSPHLSQARVDSPRSQHLPGPPSLVGGPARNHHPHHQHHPQGGGLLPGLSASGPARTPPQRALSVSPPRSSHSDMNLNMVGAAAPPPQLQASNKASLSALLHPTPASSEPSSANPGNNSAGSSPRQMTAPAHMMAGGPLPHLPPQSEDARTISVLDRKFRI